MTTTTAKTAKTTTKNEGVNQNEEKKLLKPSGHA